VELVDEVDSTNRVLLDRARDGAPHGLVLVANHQTAGRGRLDRRWEAAPGAALLGSVLLRPVVAASDLHLLTIAAALAAVDACAEVAGVGVQLKWPNDLVDDEGRKLAGLLAEAVVEGERVNAVVVGMGLNLRTVGLPEGAVALDELSADQIHRDTLLVAWLRSFGMLVDELDRDGLLRRYRASCATLGRRVRVDVGSEVIEGVALDVAGDGRLVVETAGKEIALAVGDVTHVRHVSVPTDRKG
jgi:BirA family transcriptional regulator, biotin operon repressor / biotin---[acetyl-CoA-carboxylase] ligase